MVHRRPLLEQLIERTTPLLSRALMVPGEGCDLFEAVKRLDLEGIVCKKSADPYDPKTVWFKVKNQSYSQMTENRFERFNRRSDERPDRAPVVYSLADDSPIEVLVWWTAPGLVRDASGSR